jgi:glutaredoxin
VPRLEIYGTNGCPFTKEMREWLNWLGHESVEYDVEHDPTARERMRSPAASLHTVPILVEEGRVVQVGCQGCGCSVE